MGFYPSKPKAKAQQNKTIVYASQIQDNRADLEPLTRFCDEKEYQKFIDSFFNTQAGINSANSVMQYSNFLLQRLSYVECSSLSTEPIINNAIGKFSNELFRKGFEIVCSNQTQKDYLDNRVKEIELEKILRNAIEASLIYGGCILYEDRGFQDKLDTPLYVTKEIAQRNKLKQIVCVSPFNVGASEVEMYNPLSDRYMKPNKYYINGNGNVHYTRLENLVIFNVPDLILPIFNFFGLSLCQLMKEAVRNTNTSYNALADILLRFKTDIITSDLLKINPTEAIARAQFINKSKNNLGTLLLTKDEEMQQFVTSLAGLDKVVAQLQESVAIAARMPAVKLLGLTPSGFNATGDYDLNNFYDELESMQKTILKPYIEKILRELSLEIGINEMVEVEFNSLKDVDERTEAESINLVLDSCIKGIEAGIITQEQALQIVKNAGYWNEIEVIASDSENDLDLGFDNEGI
ncbi:DUF1073 domain-containing protein [Helicobacter sp. MIT 05-5294]|uniref:phage portal protein n=1 Tax=Helicobacter sp. MIT 05-5294 TaxID=1548150 RepID=UPI00051F9238|nr:DUF1073 domain-containing protein [Helicobacter sp. MIT 05-5294]TLD85817.1 DUF1073 domain-containing protein [Helicobacter sp. MIT 05-5294]